MSRYYLLSLACLLFVLPLLTSCEQAEPLNIQTEFVEKTGTDYLNSYFTPPIMYHFAFIDENAAKYTGWIVDNKGKIRTYTLDEQVFSPTAFEILDTQMETLLEQSEVIDTEVDLEILVEYYKKNVVVAKADVQTLAENPDTETTTGFYSYSLSYGRDLESCGARSHNDRFQQTVLKSDGKESLKNKSHLTNDMVNWLEQLSQNQGL